MSYDIEVRSAPCKECGTVKDSIDVGNATWNYAPALYKVMGFSYSALDGVQAAIALPALEKGEAEMRAHPCTYEPLIKGDGTWGTMKSLLEFHRKLVEACREMPDGKISVT
jgi:hypothetical protein